MYNPEQGIDGVDHKLCGEKHMHVVIAGINSAKERKRKEKKKEERIKQPITAIKGNPVIRLKKKEKIKQNSRKNSQNNQN